MITMVAVDGVKNVLLDIGRMPMPYTEADWAD